MIRSSLGGEGVGRDTVFMIFVCELTQSHTRLYMFTELCRRLLEFRPMQSTYKTVVMNILFNPFTALA